MSFKVGQSVVLTSNNKELDGIIGTVTDRPVNSTYKVDAKRVWVDWHGDEIKRYVRVADTVCYTQIDIIRPFTKLEKALR